MLAHTPCAALEFLLCVVNLVGASKLYLEL